MSANWAKTVTIALFTHTSIGPSASSTRRGGGLDRLGVGDVGGQDERAAAAASTSRFARLEPRRARARSGRSAPVLAEAPRGRAADARRGAGDDDDVAHERS